MCEHIESSYDLHSIVEHPLLPASKAAGGTDEASGDRALVE